ncbi:MAG: hypothetical protein NTZ05_20650 [Chloroflexi bacterium]|nr:hypothetical protein [Chloroflexota bacterium]
MGVLGNAWVESLSREICSGAAGAVVVHIWMLGSLRCFTMAPTVAALWMLRYHEGITA